MRHPKYCTSCFELITKDEEGWTTVSEASTGTIINATHYKCY